MSSYGSVWVKINNPQTDLPRLREKHHSNTTLPDGSLFACAVKNEDDGEVPLETMENLSQQFGEAIFMCVQTTVDYFVYSHWCDGEVSREIHYCADEGWYELAGIKESWEQQLLSEEEKLRQLSYLDLEHLAKKHPDSAEYADAQRQAAHIEAVWSGQELLSESFYPMATASELYQLVMQEFALADPYQN